MNEAGLKQAHVLIVGHVDACMDIVRWADVCTRVEHVETLEAALEALRTEHYDLLICAGADLGSLSESRHFESPASGIAAEVQGIGICDEHGCFIWSNPRLRSLPDDLRRCLASYCVDTFAWAREEARNPSSYVRSRRLSLTTVGNAYYEIQITPVLDTNGEVTRIAVVVSDRTASRGFRERLASIERVGRALTTFDVDQFTRMDPGQRVGLIEQRLLRGTREVFEYTRLTVHRLDRQENELDLVLATKSEEGESELGRSETIAADAHGGICGMVAARGHSHVSNDVAHDPYFVEGVDAPGTAMAVPLRLGDSVIGVIALTTARLGAYGVEDRQLLEVLGHYVASALHVIELLAAEQAVGRRRMGEDIRVAVTAPLSDLATDLDNAAEGSLDEDELRSRVRALADEARSVRESLNDLASGKSRIVGPHKSGAVRHDPILAGRKVLVADDEDIIRDTVRDVLASRGCEVCAVADGAAATEAIARESFDLVLSDIKMPAKNGYEVFAAAKDRDASTPVILMTGFGYDPNHSIVRARREGLAAVLFKPFKVDQLLDEIRMALQSVKK